MNTDDTAATTNASGFQKPPSRTASTAINPTSVKTIHDDSAPTRVAVASKVLGVMHFSTVERRFEPRANLVEGRSRSEDPSDAAGFEGRYVLVWDDAAHHQQHVPTALTLQEFDDPWH